ncbi:MAG: PEP-CTERM sorting domain-containing protein [bacterium]|nr:PEP-CTERM sorting domain-containing protein [bacterium]
MIRFTKALVATAVALLLPTAASALGISIVGTPAESGTQDGVLQVGEQITFNLVLENPSNTVVAGLDVIAFGYDETADVYGTISSGLTMVGGAVTQNEVFLPFALPGSATFGLTNQFSAPTDLFTANAINPEHVRTALFRGLNMGFSAAGNGAFDLGIANGAIPSDVHFQVVFENQPTQAATSAIDVTFGTSASLLAIAIGSSAQTLAFNNASYALTLIPEPGTALLMGLGLAGLASTRRR